MKWSILFLTTFSFYISFGQSVRQSVQQAEEYIHQSNWKLAVEILERCSFFDKKNTSILIKLGDVYFMADSVDAAINCYQKAIATTENDSIYNEILFRAALVHIKQKDFYRAQDILTNKLIDSVSDVHTNQRHLYLGILALHEQKWGVMRGELAASKMVSKVEVEAIDTTHFKNPHKAKHLSMFLPGLGQLYAKDYKNAVNSFFLNTALLGLGLWAAVVYTPFDGIVWVSPWLRRYYVGGYKKAYMIVESTNRQKKEHYIKILLATD